MEPRQQRGPEIANRCYIGEQNGFGLVPSRSRGRVAQAFDFVGVTDTEG